MQTNSFPILFVRALRGFGRSWSLCYNPWRHGDKDWKGVPDSRSTGKDHRLCHHGMLWRSRPNQTDPQRPAAFLAATRKCDPRCGGEAFTTRSTPRNPRDLGIGCAFIRGSAQHSRTGDICLLYTSDAADELL